MNTRDVPNPFRRRLKRASRKRIRAERNNNERSIVVATREMAAALIANDRFNRWMINQLVAYGRKHRKDRDNKDEN